MEAFALRCIAEIIAKERGFVNHVHDNGGATNFGITIGTLSEWRKRRCTVDDVRTLTRGEAAEIYHARYWMPHCPLIEHPAKALVVFDMGVNAGVGTGIILAQRAVGVKADGRFGPITARAINKTGANEFVSEFTRFRVAYYQGLDDWPHFGTGWLRRTFSIAIIAGGMIDDDDGTHGDPLAIPDRPARKAPAAPVALSAAARAAVAGNAAIQAAARAAHDMEDNA